MAAALISEQEFCFKKPQTMIHISVICFKNELGQSNKFKKCHLIAIQEIAVSSTAMTHTYWTAPFCFNHICSCVNPLIKDPQV